MDWLEIQAGAAAAAAAALEGGTSTNSAAGDGSIDSFTAGASATAFVDGYTFNTVGVVGGLVGWVCWIAGWGDGLGLNVSTKKQQQVWQVVFGLRTPAGLQAYYAFSMLSAPEASPPLPPLPLPPSPPLLPLLLPGGV